ncbi:unnamed protein product [Caenorhabditis brenneri]
MYINWAHHYIPKFSGTCSILINSLFIYIVHDDKKIKLGDYRFLLIFFALYNFTSTAVDLLVPSCVLDYNYGFSFFIVDGVFEKKSTLGTLFVTFRCCVISAAYCILHCHFVYRYMLLFCKKVLDHYFMPYGFLFSILYCFVIMGLWFPGPYVFANADEERRNYMAPVFREKFDHDIHELNIEASPEVIRNSWIATSIATMISVYSVIVCLIFGTLIIVKLQKGNLSMSEKTKHLQKQLMKALIVQSTIPMIVCFCPCCVTWFLPVYKLDVGNWIYWISRKVLDLYFIPYGFIFSILYSFVIMSLWFLAAYVFANADEERRNYMAPMFFEKFDQDIHELNIVICLYNASSS